MWILWNIWHFLKTTTRSIHQDCIISPHLPVRRTQFIENSSCRSQVSINWKSKSSTTSPAILVCYQYLSKPVEVCDAGVSVAWLHNGYGISLVTGSTPSWLLWGNTSGIWICSLSFSVLFTHHVTCASNIIWKSPKGDEATRLLIYDCRVLHRSYGHYATFPVSPEAFYSILQAT